MQEFLFLLTPYYFISHYHPFQQITCMLNPDKLKNTGNPMDSPKDNGNVTAGLPFPFAAPSQTFGGVPRIKTRNSLGRTKLSNSTAKRQLQLLTST